MSGVAVWLIGIPTTMVLRPSPESMGLLPDGDDAAAVVAANAAGGAWSLSDLENYQTVERAPIRFSYRGATIVTAALPSAGADPRPRR